MLTYLYYNESNDTGNKTDIMQQPKDPVTPF